MRVGFMKLGQNSQCLYRKLGQTLDL